MNDAAEREIVHIKRRVFAEVSAFDPAQHGHKIADWNAATLAAFREALIEPVLLTVTLPGGVTDDAWAVTRSNGAYRVIWLPWADVFSLAVESRLGLIDINIHGDAIGCFASV